jgi:hypothetical protein
MAPHLGLCHMVKRRLAHNDKGATDLNRTIYSYPSLPYAQIPNQHHYRNGDVQRKEAPVIPKNVMYTTAVEPKFIEHLLMHKGQMVCIVTTVGKLEGVLEEAFIDHVTLLSHGKMQHIRICEIVYFEKVESKK